MEQLTDIINDLNNKRIVIYRGDKRGTEREGYLSVLSDNLQYASRILTDETAFKLYLYLLSQKENEVVSFDAKDFVNQYGVDMNEIKNAMRFLYDKGYFCYLAKDYYGFVETPYNQPISEQAAAASVLSAAKTFSSQPT